MASQFKWIPLSDCRGGRNAADDPLSLAENQVVQARNGDWFRSLIFRKLGGALAPAIGSAFTGVITSLLSHIPGNSAAASELWGADDATPPVLARMAAASTFSAVTTTDALSTGAGNTLRGASYNGKLFLMYASAVERSHVYDPNLSSPRVRRIGLATPAAPTGADTGSGTYPATGRYYRIRYRIKNGTAIVAQSEPGAGLTIIPSGSGTGLVITKPATINESETHWMLEASDDNVTFYELAETAVGTSTYTDSALVATYTDGDISAVLGAYRVPSSYKYVIAAFNRVIFAGQHTATGKQSRVWYTPAKGTSDRADDERVPDTLNVRNYFDLDEGTGGDITGFCGPLYGSIYVFKYGQIRKMLPTGSPAPVWDVSITLSTVYGAIEQECIALGRDAEGRAAVFFLDRNVGPMMVGATPPREIGAGVRDLWDDVNLDATTRVGWVLSVPVKGQVWFAWATGSNNDPNVLAIYTVATGGWSVCDTGGKKRLSRAAVLFAQTPGATMSRDVVPYIAYSGAANTLLKADQTPATVAITGISIANPSVVTAAGHGMLTGDTVQILNSNSTPTIDGERVITRINDNSFSVPVNVTGAGTAGSFQSVASDAGTTFAALLTTKPYAWNGGKPLRSCYPHVLAKAATGVTLTVTADLDFGRETRTGTVDLTPVGSETRVNRKVEGLDLAGAVYVAFSIGDAAAIAQAWTVERIMVPIVGEETNP